MALIDRLPANLKPRKPGMYCDGGGLYLQVTKSESGHLNQSWLFRFTLNGRQRYAGLGPLHRVPVKKAREKRTEYGALVQQGIDPIEHFRAKKAAHVAANAAIRTFDQCARQYVEERRASWKNAKHLYQWEATLKTYASPILGRLSVADIDMQHVLQVIGPLWTTKTETAKRLRGRIEAILNWATVSGYRKGENPARWRGWLEMRLPKPGDVSAVEHLAAMSYQEIPAFMRELRQREGVAALALEFTILTAARSGEVRNMTRAEASLRDCVWTVPAERMKGGREHRVPLSARALAILERSKAFADGELVFPGSGGNALSDMSLTAVLRRMGKGELTVHGFRSSFRDWAGDETEFSREVTEAALAHASGDKVEQAYRRSDAIEKRRRLMDAWARYCQQKPAEKVVKLRG